MYEKLTPSFEPTDETARLNASAKTTETGIREEPDLRFDAERREIITYFEEGGEVAEKRHPFQEFMYGLRDEGVRVSTGEWLDLQTLLAAGEVESLDELYIVSRAVLVKDAIHFPQFDTVFGRLFYGIEPPKDDKEEDDYDNYDEHGDANNEEEKPGDDEAEKRENENQDGKAKEVKDKEKKEPESKEVKKSEQKEKEDVDEVAEATSKTSEDVHGGDEATKDIKDSPNAADNGENPDNKGAEVGVAGSEGGGEGEGGKNKSKMGTKGEGGKNKSGMGGKGGGTGGEGTEDAKEKENEGEKENDAKSHRGGKGGGKGKRKEKTAGGGVITGGKGGYPSAREAVQERKFDYLKDDRTLGYEQFGRALSKLKTIIQETTSTRTRQLDPYGTVKSIAQHGGSPELLWKDEIEEKPNVVIMFDVGGSTDEFRPIMEKLFSASRDFLEGVEIYYFHNAIYGEVWPQKDGNWGEHFMPISEILKKDSNTKVILIGDAWMADNEYYDTPAEDSFGEIKDRFDSVVWINPIPEKEQNDMDNSGTIEAIRRVFPMYDLSLSGIEKAVRELMEAK